MSGFVHLHVHSEYSLLDGFTRIEQGLDRAQELGMEALAITDHGVMFGAVDFYKAAKKRGIKPIIGCEVYVQGESPREMHHLVLLAKNQEGYENLIKLVSRGFTEHFYYKPQVPKSLLMEHHRGLIALSACLQGEVSAALLRDQRAVAVEAAQFYKTLFGKDHFFLEIQDHGMEEQKLLNPKLLELAKQLDIGLVATNDVHYVRQEDALAHDILLCIQTGSILSDEDRMRFPSDEFYLKSEKQMRELFSAYPGAIDNTKKIADMIDFDFDFKSRHLPKFSTDPDFDAKAKLRELAEAGLAKRYPEILPEHQARLDHELGVIDAMGYNDYFLIVWDFIRYAKERGIFVGPGRGSAGGSLVSYCLNITTIDPFKYNLIFERFLNPERISMPDIDIDFEDERRQEVIDYVMEKYGSNHVAQIITFGTLAARAAVRDVGKVLGISYGEVDQVAKAIPFSLGMTLERAVRESETLQELLQQPRFAQLLEHAKKIEGVPRHCSTHAAGVVISERPTDDYVPLYVHDEMVSTQYNMVLLEELGLLKMDFLGLRNLTIIKNALQFIEAHQGIRIELEKIPEDDAKTFQMLSSGDTLGIFQLESDGMRALFRELLPESIEDIIAGISLYRPGPMESIPLFLKNRKNRQNVRYPHPTLEEIMQNTYGCLVYQEQVMQVVRRLAGYSYAQSDLIRRAMSKKKMDVMEREREVFLHGDGKGIQGCVALGLSEEEGNSLYDGMIDFARYAFVKAHAAGYAIIAYQTAWLKANYPVEFMAALLTSVMGSPGKMAQYIEDVRAMGIDVLPPDVNKSSSGFTIEAGAIRFGLLAVKNVGQSLIDSIERFRRSGYENLEDFLHRLPASVLNKRAVECLIKAGAMDSLQENRRSMILHYESIIEGIQRGSRQNAQGQLSLFEEMPQQGTQRVQVEEFSSELILNFEKEVLGMYLSGHPLKAYDGLRKQERAKTLVEILEMKEQEADNRTVTVLAMLRSVQRRVTRKGEQMAILRIEDEFESLEVLVFPRQFQEFGRMLEAGSFLLIRGRLSVKEDQPHSIILSELELLNGQSRRVEEGRLYLKISHWDRDFIEDILTLLKTSPGEAQTLLYIEDSKQLRQLKDYSVSIREHLLESLRGLLGEDAVVVREGE